MKTQEMLIEEIRTLNEEIMAFIKQRSGTSFWQCKTYKELIKKERALKYEVEKISKHVWLEETWITNLDMPEAETEEGARKAFIDRVNGMPGVTIEYDKKNRVRVIWVRSLTKVYVYSIHAYWFAKEVGTKTISGIWDEDIEIPDTKPMCSVELKQTFSAYRDDDDYIAWQLLHPEVVKEA